MKKKHILVIQNIMQTIPEDLKGKLMKEQWLTPSWRKDVLDFLAGKGKNKLLIEKFTGKEKELQHLYDTGVFSKKEMVVDKKIERLIDEFLNQEIKKAIKLGLLPKKAEALKTKSKKYARTSKGKNN